MASHAPAAKKILADAMRFETRCHEADIAPAPLVDLGAILSYSYDDIWFAVACLNELGLAPQQMRWLLVTMHNASTSPVAMNRMLQILVAAKHSPVEGTPPERLTKTSG